MAPNSTIAGSTAHTPGQCSTSASATPMTHAPSRTTPRTPSRSTTRPAKNSDDTAPSAADSSTIDSVASSRA